MRHKINFELLPYYLTSELSINIRKHNRDVTSALLILAPRPKARGRVRFITDLCRQ